MDFGITRNDRINYRKNQENTKFLNHQLYSDLVASRQMQSNLRTRLEGVDYSLISNDNAVSLEQNFTNNVIQENFTSIKPKIEGFTDISPEEEVITNKERKKLRQLLHDYVQKQNNYIQNLNILNQSVDAKNSVLSKLSNKTTENLLGKYVKKDNSYYYITKMGYAIPLKVQTNADKNIFNSYNYTTITDNVGALFNVAPKTEIDIKSFDDIRKLSDDQIALSYINKNDGFMYKIYVDGKMQVNHFPYDPKYNMNRGIVYMGSSNNGSESVIINDEIFNVNSNTNMSSYIKTKHMFYGLIFYCEKLYNDKDLEYVEYVLKSKLNKTNDIYEFAVGNKTSSYMNGISVIKLSPSEINKNSNYDLIRIGGNSNMKKSLELEVNIKYKNKSIENKKITRTNTGYTLSQVVGGEKGSCKGVQTSFRGMMNPELVKTIDKLISFRVSKEVSSLDNCGVMNNDPNLDSNITITIQNLEAQKEEISKDRKVIIDLITRYTTKIPTKDVEIKSLIKQFHDKDEHARNLIKKINTMKQMSSDTSEIYNNYNMIYSAGLFALFVGSVFTVSRMLR